MSAKIFKVVFTAYIEDCDGIPLVMLPDIPYAIQDVITDKLGKKCKVYTGPAMMLKSDEIGGI